MITSTASTLYDKELTKVTTILKEISPPQSTHVQEFSLSNIQQEDYTQSNIMTHSTHYEELQNIASSNLLLLLNNEEEYTTIVKKIIAGNLLHDYEKEYLLSGNSKFLEELEKNTLENTEKLPIAEENIFLIGNVSALFESGEEGSEAIGYDPVGGTSYGTYQFSSLTGTVAKFIEFLHEKAPNLAKELSKFPISNTGNTNGPLPSAWKKIASRDKENFRKLEDNFVNQYYFQPIIKETNGLIPLTPAIKEMLFSTAIQHGVSGASSIVKKALSKNKNALNNEKNFIKEVYAIRQQNFSSSPTHIQNAVKLRLKNEMNYLISYTS